jgi:hypothetical protein
MVAMICMSACMSVTRSTRAGRSACDGIRTALATCAHGGVGEAATKQQQCARVCAKSVSVHGHECSPQFSPAHAPVHPIHLDRLPWMQRDGQD